MEPLERFGSNPKELIPAEAPAPGTKMRRGVSTNWSASGRVGEGRNGLVHNHPIALCEFPLKSCSYPSLTSIIMSANCCQLIVAGH